MVKRRKVLLGMGALAAGSAAAMGTGAFTQTEIDRDVTGSIVADGSGSPYVDFANGGSISENSEVYTEINDGEVDIHFGANNNGGSGLNYDSENWFDKILGIRMNGTGAPADEYETWFETGTSRLMFYVAGHSGVDDPSAAQAWTAQSKQTLEPDDHLGVGVYVDLDDVTAQDGNSLSDLVGMPEDDTITFHAERI